MHTTLIETDEMNLHQADCAVREPRIHLIAVQTRLRTHLPFSYRLSSFAEIATLVGPGECRSRRRSTRSGSVVSRVERLRYAKHISVCWNRPGPIVLMLPVLEAMLCATGQRDASCARTRNASGGGGPSQPIES